MPAQRITLTIEYHASNGSVTVEEYNCDPKMFPFINPQWVKGLIEALSEEEIKNNNADKIEFLGQAILVSTISEYPKHKKSKKASRFDYVEL